MRMRDDFSPAIRPEFDRLRVVLVRSRNPLNIGAAARAMSNFGFAHLRVVTPYGPAFREARSAVGAADVLETAEEYGSVAEAVGDCALVVGTTAVGKRSIQHDIARLERGAEQLRKGLSAGNVALLFGSERTGLSNKDFSHCHWLMRIPTCEANISMNLGQAVAVCLYEIVRDGAAAPQSQSNRERKRNGSVRRIDRATHHDALRGAAHQRISKTEDLLLHRSENTPAGAAAEAFHRGRRGVGRHAAADALQDAADVAAPAGTREKPQVSRKDRARLELQPHGDVSYEPHSQEWLCHLVETGA